MTVKIEADLNVWVVWKIETPTYNGVKIDDPSIEGIYIDYDEAMTASSKLGGKAGIVEKFKVK
jgi:hypothetical protein